MKDSGNTILITGGGSGIGLALATFFAEKNNRVIITGRNADKLREACQKHPRISAIPCDVSRRENLERLVLQLEREYSDLNVLINNAAVQHNYDLTRESLPFPRIEEEIAVNFEAVVNLSTLLLPLLCAKEEAAIVNLTSGLAFTPKENAAVYCATKAAVHSFTTALRYQLEGSPVRVFELIPPLVETAMTHGRGSGKITPAEVAAAFGRAWTADQYTVSVGKIKVLRLLLRWMPGIMRAKIRKSD
ncbi:MAG: SDR family oxidoreductase [Calditrichaeota bacterium]|nr:SDR family oxidoreductase [Calditrichota bacterium]